VPIDLSFLEAKSKYELAFGLDDLARSGIVPPDERIFRFVEDDRWLVRHSAIGALAKCRDSQAETVLLSRAEHTDDPFDLAYINSALFAMGSQRSLSYLQRVCYHSTQDVACSAINAIARINGSQFVPLYIERLVKGQAIVKWYAMTALEAHGDARAVKPILTRVATILRKQRKTQQHPRSELVQALTFLARYRAVPEVAQVFEKLLPKRLDHLFPYERKQLQELGVLGNAA
jgi:hypothetical protein